QTVEAPIVGGGGIGSGSRSNGGAGQSHEQGFGRVANGQAHVLSQQDLELLQGPLLVFVGCDLHFPEYEGMGADGTLAEDHQATGEDVGALHGNANGDGLIDPAQEVTGPDTDTTSAKDIHGLVDHHT